MLERQTIDPDSAPSCWSLALPVSATLLPCVMVVPLAGDEIDTEGAVLIVLLLAG